jgi:hypothetical protein
MKYKVLRPLRWRQRDYERGETIIPKTDDEAQRCQLLVDSGFLAPTVSDELLRNLQSVGVFMPPRVHQISTASNNVKQEGEKENG